MAARRDAAREKQERFSELGHEDDRTLREHLHDDTPDGYHTMSRNQWAERQNVINAFIEGRKVYRLQSKHGRPTWVALGNQASFQGPASDYSLDPKRDIFKP